MRIAKAGLMAASMFSILPCPNVWDEDALPWVMPFFPAIGLILGALWLGLSSLVGSWPPALAAFVLAIWPWLFSGLMHLDGYMDVCDALLSRRDQPEMLRILKDPHTGAFAVIAVVLLIIGQVCGFMPLAGQAIVLWPLLVMPVFSRAMAALLIECFAPMPGSGYAKMLHAGVGGTQRLVTAAIGLVSFVVLCVIQWQVALVMAVMFALASWGAVRKLGGVNGDITGFALMLSELAGLIALAVSMA